MISLHNVSFSFRQVCVFENLSLKLEASTSYLITGANGSGKTTLLKVIGGTLTPTKGNVKYDSLNDALDWNVKYEWRKNHIHYLPVQSIHDLISSHELFYQQRYYAIESTEIPTVRNYLGSLVEKLESLELPHSFQIESLFNIELTRLSNGQVKKVVILKRLLAAIPSVLLLDYPFEGLDAASRKELRDFLDHLVVVHRIQLIVADHEHPELPISLKKKITLHDSQISIDNLLVPSKELTQFSSSISTSNDNQELVVEMRNVKIQYGSKVILENLDWKIQQGERWALTGRNGSGKTTLFSLIYADHPMAYSEKVFLFGKRRGSGESIWDIKNRISYLGPEQIHFLDYFNLQLTVKEYLERTKASQENIERIIDQFHATQLLAKPLKHLSNGQMQLVLLINLFLSQKELLLLDEPFQFLDPATKSRVNEYLLSHLDPSATLVLITHYESDVEKWTRHKLVLPHHVD